ncbi:MAG: hypothetical protein O7A67_00890 [SAR324 cluster bacterium]|nr:hypothetical protein [SAR324 cluster bacterium]
MPLLALLLGLLGGCTGDGERGAGLPEGIEFSPGNISAALPEGHPWTRVTLLGASGAALLVQPVPAGTPLPLRFDYDWRPGEALSLRLEIGAGAASVARTVTLDVPEGRLPTVGVALQLPAGVPLPAGAEPLLLPAGAAGPLGLLLTHLGEGSRTRA